MAKTFTAEQFVHAARIAITAIAGSCIQVPIIRIDLKSAINIIRTHGGELEANALLLVLDGLKTALVNLSGGQPSDLCKALDPLRIDGNCDSQCDIVAKLMDEIRLPQSR